MDRKKRDELLGQFVARLAAAAGSNLESVILYGSAAGDNGHDHLSDLNLLCVLRSVAAEELLKLTDLLAWWSREKGQRPPLFFTAQELRNSADVFAVELCDMQATHKVLYGQDVIAPIEIPMNLHRVQVERELRTLVLKLRQHFLQTPADAKTLHAILAKSYSSTKTLVRHALIAAHAVVPNAETEFWAKAAQVFEADTTPLRAARELRDAGAAAPNVASAYGAYMGALGKIAEKLDRLLPKSEWQRIKDIPSKG
jgi:predicted nucleotidyltransferase